MQVLCKVPHSKLQEGCMAILVACQQVCVPVSSAAC